LVLVPLLQLLQLLVVGGGQTSERGDVNDDQNSSLVGGQIDLFPVPVGQGIVVNSLISKLC
jgi:hypothetical protein